MTVENSTMTAVVKLFERGQLKAFVDVTFRCSFGEITILGFRVIQDGTKPPWVAYPSVSYPKDGKNVTKPLVEATRQMQQAIVKLVLDAYHEALAAA